MLKKLCMTILLLLALRNSPKAQQIDLKFEHFSIEQGLSQSYVYCILQDRQGFMWFGTQDGLNRYDGYSFTVYKNRPQDSSSLSNNYINSIYEDRSGALWVGTGGGLNRYDPKSQTFTVYRNDPNNPNSLSNDLVHSIYEDRLGALWIGTEGGLNRYDPKSQAFTVYRNDPKNPNSLSNNIVYSIYEDSKGALWIGTNDGLNRYDSKSQSFIVYRNDPKNPNSLSKDLVRSIYEDRSGVLWVGTEGGGLNRYDPKRQAFAVYRNDPGNPKSLSKDLVHSIYEDGRGMLWIGTYGGGLNRYDPVSSTFALYHNDLNNPNSLSNDLVYSIYEDRSGALWIGTGGGLNRYDPKSQAFTVYRNDPKNPNSLSNNIVYSIYEDSKGALWIGTNDGLNRYDSKSQAFTVYRNDPNNPKSLSNNIVYSIYEDSKGTLWIGTNDGLNRYDLKNQSFIVYRNDPNNPKGLSSNVVWSFYEDSSGTLWLGTYRGGLNRYDSKSQTFTSYRNDPNTPNSLSNNNVRTIYGDGRGVLWIGTDSGLNRYDLKSQTFTVYRNDPKNPNSSSDNIVSSVFEDMSGTLWIGTADGLNRYEPESQTFTRYTESDGLPNKVVYGILGDKEGDLWLSTNKGISKFNPQTRKFKNYDLADGLQSNEFNSFSYYKSRSGEMFFGGINGFNRFYPEWVKDNPYIPPIAITSFKILDSSTDKASLVLAQSAGLANGQPLELSYKENVFSFEFAALNFTRPEKNQYGYILEGFDKDWIKCGTQRYVRYTNLGPGEYLFRVKGSNNDGVWNEAGISVRIRIIPPPWRTWWAYLLYLAGLVGVGYGGFQYRLKAIERRNQIERAVEIDRKNRELEDKNEELARKNEELNESHKRADRIFSALAEALPGTVLDGKYRLDEKIGSGGFGAVYRATHLAMKRPIAVKVFKPVPGNDSAEALERFRLEAVSACRINHLNAVAVLDSGISSEGIAYLVMELLEGHTLTDELRLKKRVSIERAAQILIPVCDVLSKSHSMGIVHRDIKPDNIFLHRGEEGEVVKIVDFGIAKLMEASGSVDVKSLTATGGILGTPTYMSPERIEGKPYDGRSDVYSLGVVLYEMLCGRAPFESDSKGVFGLVQMHLMKEPKPLRETHPDIPEAVEAVVLSALAKDPERRPTAKELGQEFLAATGIDPASLSRCSGEFLEFDLPKPEMSNQEQEPTSENKEQTGLTAEVFQQVEKLMQSMLDREPDRLAALLKDRHGAPLIGQSDIKRLAEKQEKKALTPERWQQMERIFYAALECEPDRRGAFLDEACSGDIDLRRRVESLIVSDQED